VAAEPERQLSPGGESLSVFKSRVNALLRRFAEDHDGRTVVAVCHGGIIWATLYHLFGVPDGTISAEVEFTSITEWKRDGGRWHLVRFNDVAHLLGSELLAPAQS
jgi:probable phosphoglycerate mutase